MVAIQEFLANLIQSFITVIRIVLLSGFGIKIKKEPSAKDCVILGNGPSLQDSLKNNSAFLEGKLTFSVNLFPTSELYEQIKPDYYVTAAPEFWLRNANKIYAENRKKIFDSINEKTTWQLKLYVPYKASKLADWKKEITNPNVKILYFNNTPVEGFTWFRHLLFRMNLGMPRPHNVMVPSIFLALNAGFKKVYLWGADHNWLSEIFVDENNRVFLTHKHFYNAKDVKPEVMQKAGKGERKLHEMLMKFVHTFESYFVLKEYAGTLKAEILNTTPGSFIDAFDRIKLEKNS